MQKTEQRAFAAVDSKSGKIDIRSVALNEVAAGYYAGMAWPGGWKQARYAGWRIRPVLIRVEDENEGAPHDR
jgi:hypothetical protein